MTNTNLFLSELFEKYPNNFFYIGTTPDFEKQYDLKSFKASFYPKDLLKDASAYNHFYEAIMFIDDTVESCGGYDYYREELILPEKIDPEDVIVLRFYYIQGEEEVSGSGGNYDYSYFSELGIVYMSRYEATVRDIMLLSHML